MKKKDKQDSKKASPEKEKIDIVATHHEARRDYFIEETHEAGIMLGGCEVKSLRLGKSSLAGSFGVVTKGECWLHNFYIPPYDQGNRENPEPRRPRKLLLHRREIDRLHGKVQEKGFAIIPLKVYFKHGLAKVEIALGKGKKLWDKRSDIKKASADRDMDRAMKNRNRG